MIVMTDSDKTIKAQTRNITADTIRLQSAYEVVQIHHKILLESLETSPSNLYAQGKCDAYNEVLRLIENLFTREFRYFDDFGQKQTDNSEEQQQTDQYGHVRRGQR